MAGEATVKIIMLLPIQQSIEYIYVSVVKVDSQP